MGPNTISELLFLYYYFYYFFCTIFQTSDPKLFGSHSYLNHHLAFPLGGSKDAIKLAMSSAIPILLLPLGDPIIRFKDPLRSHSCLQGLH